MKAQRAWTVVLSNLACLSLLAGLAAWAAPAKGEPTGVATIIRHDPRFDQLVPKGAMLEMIADGFTWVEGPVWDRKEQALLFSDIPANAVFKWKEGEGAKPFLAPSGYTGTVPFTGKEPGSNGLTFDANGRLVLCKHGDRQIARLEANGTFTVLADRYDGHRINSPNDLVIKSTGEIYFTDPPFGLPKAFDDTGKAPIQGVYRVSRDGNVTLLIKDLKAPNGIAFSPDQKKLYISNADPMNAVWMVFDVKADGTIENGKVLFNATAWTKSKPGVPDGMTIDVEGGLWVALWSGGAVHRYLDGHLDRVITMPVSQPTSCAFGGDNFDELFVTSASDGLSAEERAAQPLAGAVFRLRPGVRGLPPASYIGA